MVRFAFDLFFALDEHGPNDEQDGDDVAHDTKNERQKILDEFSNNAGCVKQREAGEQRGETENDRDEDALGFNAERF